MNSQPDISIIIPCYNEENHIAENIEAIRTVLSSRNYEIILVDDKSIDNTRNKIELITGKYSNIYYIFHEKNLGKGAAIASGSKISKGKYILHIDIDLEVSANYITEIISELENGNDIVLVKRKVRSNFNLLRDISGMTHRWLVKILLQIPNTDVQSGCKGFSRIVFFTLLPKIKSQGWFFDVEMIVHAYRNHFRIKQIKGLYIRDKKKKSSVNLFRDGIKQLEDLLQFRRELQNT